jgi:hypothetical protein
MPVSDGGSPFAAQQNAGRFPAEWHRTVTVRNTGTAASSGTTQIQLSMDYTSSHLQPASGSGWSCDTTSCGATCINTAAVPAGGSLPRARDQGRARFRQPPERPVPMDPTGPDCKHVRLGRHAPSRLTARAGQGQPARADRPVLPLAEHRKPVLRARTARWCR